MLKDAGRYGSAAADDDRDDPDWERVWAAWSADGHKLEQNPSRYLYG